MRTPQIAWIYLRYQIVTKLLIGFVILPVFGAIRSALFDATGRAFLSSGDIALFLTSVTGWAFALIACLFFLLVIGIDLFAFVRISEVARIQKKRLSIWQALRSGIRSIRRFLCGWGIVVLVYIGIIMPIIGLGLTTSTTQKLTIPEFVASVMYANQFYTAIYIVCSVVLIWCGILHIFTLQGVIIDEMPVARALRQSRQIMRHHTWRIVGRVLYNEAWMALVVVICIVVALVITFLAATVLRMFHVISGDMRIYIVMLMSVESISIATLLITPWIVDILTRIYLNYTRATEREALHLHLEQHQNLLDTLRYTSRFDKETYIAWYKDKVLRSSRALHEQKQKARSHIINPFARAYRKTTLLITTTCVLLFGFNAVLAWAIQADPESFFSQNDARIIAHRAGGDLGPENTTMGMRLAELAGAQASEIDVQRTLDGAYVIFHDANAKRSAGVNKKITDMTLDEVKKLQVKNTFDHNAPTSQVPTLEEYLDALTEMQKSEALQDKSERMGVLIELKGKSADTKMADDVVALIHKKHLEESAYVITLDYDLISYVEQTYPDITTGYLYYFNFGDITKADVDILIMEEGVAREEVVDELHAAGKKAYVWTINTPDAMEHFAVSNIDGIITDHVREMMHVRQTLATQDAWDKALNWTFDMLKWDE